MPKELTPANIRSSFRFNQTLNKQIWLNGAMRSNVRHMLLKSALAFYKFLDVDGLAIKDVVLTGSNAAYNYTPMSDIDVHFIVDFANTVCPDLADNFFRTKKALWSATYDVTIRGHAVELYVEDKANPAHSNGLYSLLHGKWLRHAERAPPAPDDSAIVKKVEAYVAKIDALIDSEPNAKDIDHLLERLSDLRRSGLLNGGEFSTENLTYKVLRNLGYLDRLWDARKVITAASLSLEASTPSLDQP